MAMENDESRAAHNDENAENRDPSKQKTTPDVRRNPGETAEPAAGPNESSRPRMSWDEMMSTPAESKSIVEAMRDWASRPADELEPRRGRRLLRDAEIQPTDSLPTDIIPPVGDRPTGSPSAEPSVSAQPPPRTIEPRAGATPRRDPFARPTGLPRDAATQEPRRLPRLFGRKKDEPGSPPGDGGTDNDDSGWIDASTGAAPTWGKQLTFKEPHGTTPHLGEPAVEVPPGLDRTPRLLHEPPEFERGAGSRTADDDAKRGEEAAPLAAAAEPAEAAGADISDSAALPADEATNLADSGAQPHWDWAAIASRSIEPTDRFNAQEPAEEPAGSPEPSAPADRFAGGRLEERSTMPENPLAAFDTAAEAEDERIIPWDAVRARAVPAEEKPLDVAEPAAHRSSETLAAPNADDDPWGSSGLFEAFARDADEPATAAGAAHDLAAETADRDSHAETFADALAKLEEDDPWRDVSQYDPPSALSDRPGTGAGNESPDGIESGWDVPIDEAPRARDVFGGESAFGGPQRGALSRWGERLRDETELPGPDQSALTAEGGTPPDRPWTHQPVARHPMAGDLDSLLGQDSEALLREIDAERIDAGRRSPTMRLRPGSDANDALWERDENRLAPADDAFSPGPVPWEGGASFDDEFADIEPAAGHRSASKAWVREVVETGLLALLVFLAVRASFQNFKVDGHSMDPTLEDGQLIIVNKLVYADINIEKLGEFLPFIDTGSSPTRSLFHGPERGDIVVLMNPINQNEDLIKRVIGLPGETIEIVDGKVYINDHLLIEPYITAKWHDTKPKQTIPAGQYFVMGDNRDNSKDSRYPQVGPIPKQLIIGKAMVSYWPMGKFGLAANEEGSISKDQTPQLSATLISR